MPFQASWDTIGKSLMFGIPANTTTSHFTTIKHLQGSRWKALFSKKARPVLVPADQPVCQKKALEFFLTNPLRLSYAKTLLQLNRYAPWIAKLPEMNLSHVEGSTLLDQLGLPASSRLAFLIGTPGPYQKTSVLVMSNDGKPLALAKIALKESADPMVQAEAEWLSALGNAESLVDQVPKILNYGTASNGRSYVALSIAPDNFQTTTDFTPIHADFLKRLGKESVSIKLFTDSSEHRFLEETLNKLKPLLTTDNYQLLSTALNDTVTRLADWQGPFVVMHGDFAPWNLRLYSQKLFAFDWEYAQEDSSPLHDYFHFLLIQQALTGRGISSEPMKVCISRAREFLAQTYADVDWSNKIISTHGLLYLLHTILWYARSSGQLIEKHPVIAYYSQLIRDRKSWM